ncbi:MAG: hypothetical protein HONDAALG_04340 [Gammaproteobacteria bacterium]|nr:hypothetical protein [Gammaproteobacteria bacterium]
MPERSKSESQHQQHAAEYQHQVVWTNECDQRQSGKGCRKDGGGLLATGVPSLGAHPGGQHQHRPRDGKTVLVDLAVPVER